jgi:hypothetical protein
MTTIKLEMRERDDLLEMRENEQYKKSGGRRQREIFTRDRLAPNYSTRVYGILRENVVGERREKSGFHKTLTFLYTKLFASSVADHMPITTHHQ